MGILADGNDWTDELDFSPPGMWNLFESDDKFRFVGPQTMDRWMRYTGAGPLPASVVVAYEIDESPQPHGDIYLQWRLEEFGEIFFFQLPEDIDTTGTVEIDTSGSVGGWFELRVSSTEDETDPYTYSANVQIFDATGAFIALQWTEGTEGTFPLAEYTLQKAINSVLEDDFEALATVPFEDDHVYDDADIEQGNTYSYRVKVTDEEGNDSVWSNIVTIEYPIVAPCEIYSLDAEAATAPPMHTVSGTGSTVTFSGITPLDDGNENRLLVAVILLDTTAGGEEIADVTIGGQPCEVATLQLEAGSTGFLLAASLIDANGLSSYDIVVTVGPPSVQYRGTAQIFTYGNVNSILVQNSAESLVAQGGTLSMTGGDTSAFENVLFLSAAAMGSWFPPESEPSELSMLQPFIGFSYTDGGNFPTDGIQVDHGVTERAAVARVATYIGVGIDVLSIQWSFSNGDSEAPALFGAAITALIASSMCDAE